MRVVIVHKLVPGTNYTRLLYQGFRDAHMPIDVILYGRKQDAVPGLRDAKRVWTSFLYPFQIFRAIVGDRPDIVHVQYEFTSFGPIWTSVLLPALLLLLRMQRAKVVVTVHSVIPPEIVDSRFVRLLFPGFGSLRFGALFAKLYFVFSYRSLVIFAKKIIVHGEWYRKELDRAYGAGDGQVWVIPYGVQTYKECTPSFDSQIDALRGREFVLSFGSVSPRKDLVTLIRAFARFLERFPDYALIIAGQVPEDFRWYSEVLKSTSKELGIQERVILTAFVSDDEIQRLYQAAQFVVFPYLFSFEGPSGPLAFAIQNSVAIIGTRVGFLGQEITDDLNGLLVPNGDADRLCAAMVRLAGDKVLRSRLAANLGSKKEALKWSRVAIETSRVYMAAAGAQ